MWRVIVVEVGSLFGSRVGAVYVPVSCSSFFPPVVSGGLHIVKIGYLLVSPHSCLKWFSSALRFEALSCWRCGAQRPLILSMCCIAGLFAPKWAVVFILISGRMTVGHLVCVLAWCWLLLRLCTLSVLLFYMDFWLKACLRSRLAGLKVAIFDLPTIRRHRRLLL